jgi:MFS family permease
MRLTNTSSSTLGIEAVTESRGSAVSIIQCMQFLGFACSPILMSPIYVSSGIDPIYISNAFLLMLSIIFIALIRVPKRNA